MSDRTIDADEAEDILYSDTLISRHVVSEHRWYRKQLVVYRGLGGDLWGFHYLEPASELQEDQDRFESDPVPVFPVVAREVVSTVYEAA